MAKTYVELLPVQLDTKLICTLETDLSKLFRSSVTVANVAATNSKIIWHDAPFMQYEKHGLNDNFGQYLETSLLPKKVF